jgi:hypothetical protein
VVSERFSSIHDFIRRISSGSTFTCFFPTIFVGSRHTSKLVSWTSSWATLPPPISVCGASVPAGVEERIWFL